MMTEYFRIISIMKSNFTERHFDVLLKDSLPRTFATQNFPWNLQMRHFPTSREKVKVRTVEVRGINSSCSHSEFSVTSEVPIVGVK